MRREVTVTLDDRGNELTFKIREMSALQLERWIMRAAVLLARGGTALQDMRNAEDAFRLIGSVRDSLTLNVLAGIDVEKAGPLLDDLLLCCRRVVGKAELQLTHDTVDDVIQDVRTLFALRLEALKLNLDFFHGGGLFSSPSSREEKNSTEAAGEHTPTSAQ